MCWSSCAHYSRYTAIRWRESGHIYDSTSLHIHTSAYRFGCDSLFYWASRSPASVRNVDADDVGMYYSDLGDMGDLLVGVEIAHPMLYKFVKSKEDSEVEIHAWICGAHAQLLYCY